MASVSRGQESPAGKGTYRPTATATTDLQVRHLGRRPKATMNNVLLTKKHLSTRGNKQKHWGAARGIYKVSGSCGRKASLFPAPRTATARGPSNPGRDTLRTDQANARLRARLSPEALRPRAFLKELGCRDVPGPCRRDGLLTPGIIFCWHIILNPEETKQICTRKQSNYFSNG